MKENNQDFFKKIIFILKPHYRELLLTLVFIFLGAVIRLQYPLIIKIIVDDVLLNQNRNMLFTMLIIYILLFVLSFLFSFLTDFVNSLNSQHIALNIKRKIFSHLQRIPMTHLNKEAKVGEIISLFNDDITTISQFMSLHFLNLLTNTLSIAIIIYIMFIMNPSLALYIVLIIPLFCFSILLTNKSFGKALGKRRRFVSEVNKLLQNVFPNVKIVKLFSAHKFFNIKFLKLQDEVIDTEVKTSLLTSLLIQLSQLIFVSANVVIIWFGANLVFQEILSIGGLMAFYTYVPLLFMPMRTIINSIIQMKRFRIALNKIFKYIELDEEQDADTHLLIKHGQVEFRNVDFAYNTESGMVLENINMSIQPGEKIALIGRNGCGKTTLVNLILKLYPVTGGEVYVDNINIYDLNNYYLRKSIGIVTQEVNFFNLTINENLRIARKNCTRNSMIEACKLSGAHDFIMELEHDYDTMIGEKGYNLSGGQLQKLSIARLILKQPKIIIFDEATSSLDQMSIQTFYKLFQTIFKDTTIIFILHDLNKVVFADRIFLLKDGSISKIYGTAELEDDLLKRLTDEIA